MIPAQINLDTLSQEPMENLVMENTYFNVYCPDFSQWPYEVWITPKVIIKKYGDINSIPFIRQFQALRESADDLSSLLSLLKTSIDEYGDPVLSIITEVLELARPLLQAKFSDTYKNKHATACSIIA